MDTVIFQLEYIKNWSRKCENWNKLLYAHGVAIEILLKIFEKLNFMQSSLSGY